MKNIKLNAPKIEGEFMTALKNRKSERHYEGYQDFTNEELSELLWVANGNIRTKEELEKNKNIYGHKTNTVISSLYQFDIFFVLKQGVYYYNQEKNELSLLEKGDHRKDGMMQPFIGRADGNMYFVWNKLKYKELNDPNLEEIYKDPSKALSLAAMDCGAIAHNINLYCSLKGLKTVCRAMVGDHDVLKKLFRLNDNQRVVMANCLKH